MGASNRPAFALPKSRHKPATGAMLECLVEHPAIGMALLTFDREVVYANRAYDRLSGAVEHFFLANSRPIGTLIGDDVSQRFEHWYTEQGEWRCVAITLCPYRGAAGDLESAILTVEDLTNFKSAVATPSHTDELTGLPNRIEFERCLVELWQTSAAEPAALRLALLDLDHFKNFNESLGHAIGDEVLCAIARRLSAIVGPRARVARFGRDTFAVAMFSPSPQGDDDIDALVKGILREPIVVQEKTYALTASAGIASRSSATASGDVLVRNAEIALNRAKLSGGNRSVHFEDGMHDDALKRFELIRDLRAALGTVQLFVLYQPVIDLSTGKLQGLEALARWQHPKYGEISPTEFIPLAEQMGMAADVGSFVFEAAMQQLKLWQAYKALSMHVNVSASEIVELDVAGRLIEVVDRVGVDPKSVVIEITESVILENNAHTQQTLRRLRARGFRICIDDFGTGYSSLRYLTQFPIDAIKIDRSFVSNTREQLASEPIVKTLLKLAETFNIDVIAEGVESPMQDDALRSLGCLAGQGFLYDRPQSAEHLAKRYPLLREN